MTKPRFKWREHRPGADPKTDEIVRRRFGSRHERPCNNPNMLTCASAECQYANACQWSPQEGAVPHE